MFEVPNVKAVTCDPDGQGNHDCTIYGRTTNRTTTQNIHINVDGEASVRQHGDGFEVEFDDPKGQCRVNRDYPGMAEMIICD